ncbi:hypothetical protein NIES4073_22000 [Kalymmatonema gypsitolerans NIES-4073]|nr:hypothetical protein NIES4073_22000 [Scytonema sp. NIES-4073]
MSVGEFQIKKYPTFLVGWDWCHTCLREELCHYLTSCPYTCSQFSLHPTPVLSYAKTAPPLAKGRGLRGGVKPTWDKGLNVIIDTNGVVPVLETGRARMPTPQDWIINLLEIPSEESEVRTL